MNFYRDTISNASNTFAAGTIITGLLLIGFGVIIIALPEVFAFLAAVVFFLAGLGCAVTGIKIFLTMRKIEKMDQNENGYRKNVRISSEQHFDL